MSGRNNDREGRVRDREQRRDQDPIVIAIRRHAENRGGVAVVPDPRPVVHRPASPRGAAGGPGSTSASSPHGTKRKMDLYGTETVEQWASTELEQETFAFLWSIKNYSALSSGSEEIKSPVFKGGLKSNHLWQMKMNPRKKLEEVEYFAVHLILNGFGDGDNQNTRKLKVRFQISLLDPDGRPLKQAGSPNMTVCEFKKYSVWGYDKFLQTSDLLAPSRRLVEEDTLKIHCRVWIEGDLKHKLGQGGASLESKELEDVNKRRRFELLSENMAALLGDTMFADVALSTETKTFMAHKAVLGARSTVFQAMFNTPMKESTQNSVDIPDFDEDVVKAMLEYIYTGETSDLNEKAGELMQIAEKYDLNGLKEDCELAIAHSLTVDNAAEVLVLSHLHNAENLKIKAIDFINRNKEDVKKTNSFKEAAHTHAAVFVDLYLSQ